MLEIKLRENLHRFFAKLGIEIVDV